MKVLVLVLSVVALSQARPSSHYEAAMLNKPALYFTWKDCGQHPMRPLKIHSLSVMPDPVRIPGDVRVSYDVECTRDITNMDVKLDIKKKVTLIWVDIPCISGFGSCFYDDICQYINEVPGASCPIKAGRHSTDEDFVLSIPDLGLGGLVMGKYRIKTYFSETGSGMELGCFQADIEIKKA